MGYLTNIIPLRVSQKPIKLVIERIKSGDDRELAQIYTDYRSEFISWITKNYHCNVEEAKDVYQFSIMTFYENIINNKLVDLKSSVKTYLFAIGKNKILEKRKHDSRFDSIHLEGSTVDEISASEEAMEKESSLQMVEQCLEQLGDPCKSLLELYYYNKMSMEEITETLNYKNAATAKNLKYKCLNRLRKLYMEASKQNKAHNFNILGLPFAYL